MKVKALEKQISVKSLRKISKRLFLIQFILISLGIFYGLMIHMHMIEEGNPLMYIGIYGVLFFVTLGNAYFTGRYDWTIDHLSLESDSKEDAIKNVERFNKDLRSQRHDFLNHIQVLYSLMELEEYEETRTYLNHLYGDIIKVGSKVKTESVSVNALLQAKASQCEKEGILFDIHLKSRLSGLPLSEWDFCRIMGNLIDNSIEALRESQKKKKVITLQIYETIKGIEVRVRNNGPFIPENMVKKIFEAGVSSKKDKEDHGLGLYIIKKILDEGGHGIVLEQENDVCFHITLEKLTKVKE